MTKAYITTFHNYSKPLKTDYYKILWDYWVKQLPLWWDEVDKVYIIDTNWHPDIFQVLVAELKDKLVYIKSEINGHHNVQYQHYLPHFTEDMLLFMDNDVLITKKEGISKWFELAEGKDAVITFAPWKNYPLGDLRKPIWTKYPEVKNKGVYMNSCHFLITRQFLNKLSHIDFMNYQPFPVNNYIPELDYITKEGDWCEMFALLWFQILQHKNWVEMPKIKGYRHHRGLSYAYLILSYKKLGLPQYKELHLPDFKERLEVFKKIDIEGKYHKEVDEILKEI